MNNSLPSQTKYVPISEAAKFLGVSLDTIRRWDSSGILHSKRLDGKNRYFSFEDLKRNQLDRPLSISEVSKKFNISATTLRRLETRGIVKPARNKAGERVFDSAIIEKFAKSEYFHRKKYTRKQKPVVKNEASTSQVKENIKPEFNTELNSDQKTRPVLANFIVVSVAAFILLLTVGLGNVFLFKTQNYEVLPLPVVLGGKITAPPLVPVSQYDKPAETSSIVRDEIQIQEPETTLEKYLADSLKMINENKQYKKSFQTDSLRLVEIATDSAIIRQQPSNLSAIVGSTGSGEVFEFLSFNSGWVELKLHESTQSGFVREEYTSVKEFEISLPESEWTKTNESTNSALIEQSAIKEGTNDQSTN